jgi:signal transduction histidine kinase
VKISPESHPAARYGLAAVAVAVAAVVRWALHGLFGDRAAFITFHPALALVAMWAGGRAGLVATVLSVLAADYLFLEPIGSLGLRNMAEGVALTLFGVSGLLVSAMATRLGRARRGEAEARAQQRLNRTLRALDKSNQAMVRAASETDLLEEVCRIVVHDCGYAMVWIGFAEEDENKSVRPVAHAGFDEGYLRTLDLSWADTERGRGPTGTAIRTGKPCGCRNMRADGNFTPWREEALKRGYGSSLALPLLAESKVLGAITIYSRQSDCFAEDEVRLLSELANDLAYGIVGIRLRSAKSAAEQALRRARDELALANAELEDKVRERTAKLQEALAELEHFSYTITHDMRAPLRAMQGFADILMKEACLECPMPQNKEWLRRIATSSTRMDRLITDALNYSRAVQEELRLGPVDAGALLRGIIESYPLLQPPNARIHIAESLPLILGNEAGLTQCFSNLLHNAVKFVAPAQLPEVWIRAETNDGTVRLWFEDNGIGIPKQAQGRLFQMFQRVSRGYEGTGIGLALVKKVAERMGGRVGVESDAGQGSRFWLEFNLPQ